MRSIAIGRGMLRVGWGGGGVRMVGIGQRGVMRGSHEVVKDGAMRS